MFIYFLSSNHIYFYSIYKKLKISKNIRIYTIIIKSLLNLLNLTKNKPNFRVTKPHKSNWTLSLFIECINLSPKWEKLCWKSPKKSEKKLKKKEEKYVLKIDLKCHNFKWLSNIVAQLKKLNWWKKCILLEQICKLNFSIYSNTLRILIFSFYSIKIQIMDL